MRLVIFIPVFFFLLFVPVSYLKAAGVLVSPAELRFPLKDSVNLVVYNPSNDEVLVTLSQDPSVASLKFSENSFKLSPGQRSEVKVWHKIFSGQQKGEVLVSAKPATGSEVMAEAGVRVHFERDLGLLSVVFGNVKDRKSVV